MKHFAIVAVAEESLEEKEDHGVSSVSTTDIREDVTSIYESYASMYPNPSLINEIQERDALLRAVSAASEAVERNPAPKRRSGLFSFLFGSSKKHEDDANEQQESRATNQAMYGLGSKEEGDSRLRYIDLVDDESIYDDLCGTQRGLDVECIPAEAHALARLCITSKQKRKVNVCRNTWERPGSSLVVITGLGQLVEFKTSPDGPQLVAEHQSTSDRQALHDHLETHAMIFSVEYARAAMVGPNFLVVSWGLIDGLTLFYRRMQKKNTNDICWQSVAATAPTRQVMGNLEDLFAGDDMTSVLLVVTDVIPLAVERGEDAPAVTLAISRLGGYLELIPLPTGLWYGPELQAPTHKTKKKNQKMDHYATGLPNLALSSKVMAMTTLQYHADVMGISAFRTRVESATDEWNRDMYPSNPPAQHVLVAHGAKEGTERLSFWAVCTLFPEHKNEPRDDIGFSLHSTIVEALDVGCLGPDMTLFANREIMRFWRKERSVELATDKDGRSTLNPSAEPPSTPITTISVSKPIVDIQCCASTQATLIAILDGNGGVTYMDCTRLERLSSHALNHEEYTGLFRNEDPDTSLPLVHTIAERAHVRSLINSGRVSSKREQSICAIQFLPRALSTAFGGQPAVALVSETDLFLCSLLDVETNSVPVSVNISEVHGGVAIHCLLRQGMQLVSRRYPNGSLTVTSIQPQTPAAIVQTLERRGDLKDALEAADKLGLQEREKIAQTVEFVKRRLWEAEGDLSALRSVADDLYVISQALDLCEAKSSVKHIKCIDDLSCILQLGLERLSHARVATTTILGGSHSVEEATTKIRDCFILLGTYQLLGRLLGEDVSPFHFLSSFVSVGIEELACIFAENANIMGLSLLLIRHWRLLTSRCEWILRIPPTLPTTEYVHCIPAIQGEKVYFIPTFEKDDLMEIESLPKYFMDELELEVILDDADKKAILNSVGSADLNDTRIRLTEIYVSRTRMVQQFTGSVEYAFEFSRTALLAIGSQGKLPDDPAASLYKLHERIQVLRNMLIAYPEIANVPSSVVTLTVEFLGADLLGLLSIVYKSGGDWDGMVHTINALRCLIDTTEKNFGERIIAGCSGLLHSASYVSKKELFQYANICAAIAFLSRTTIVAQERLINKKDLLLKFSEETIEQAFRLLGRMNFSVMDVKDLIGTLWVVYEALPSKIPKKETNVCDCDELKATAKRIYSLLAGVDLVSDWEDNRAMVSSIRTLMGEKDIDGNACEVIVSNLCASFFGQTASNGASVDPQATEELLHRLLSDLHELTSIFACGKKLASFATKNLLVPLLKTRELYLLAVALGNYRNKILDVPPFSKAVISCTNAEAFSQFSPDVDFIATCRNFVGDMNPELRNHFKAIQICLESSKYLNSLPLKNREKFTPADLKELKAIDVIELLLTKFPRSIVFENDEWADSSSAAIMNSAIREIMQNESENDQNLEGENAHLPRIPGQTVFRLAEILQLVNESDVIAVKCRTVQHGILSGFHGASAALCRSMLTADLMWSKNKTVAMEHEIMHAVHLTVASEEYEDLATKRELCNLAMSFPWVNTSGSFFRGYEKILSAWVSTEYRYLASTEMKTSLRKFQRETLSEHSVDILRLFDLVAHKASDGLDEENILAPLSKHTLSWCTSTSDEERVLEWNGDERFSGIGNIGISLLLHIRDEALVIEMLDQVTETIKREPVRKNNGAHQSRRADEEIVQLLQQRGISRFGAIRAATSSPHVSFNDALQWAVKHAGDPGFNDPILIVRNQAGFIHSHRDQGSFLRSLERLRNPTRKQVPDAVLPGHVSSSMKSVGSSAVHATQVRERSTPTIMTDEMSDVDVGTSLLKLAGSRTLLATEPGKPISSTVEPAEKLNVHGVSASMKSVQPTKPLAKQPHISTTSSVKTAEKSNLPGVSSLAKPVEPTKPLVTQPQIPTTSSVKTAKKSNVPGFSSLAKPVEPTKPLATQPQIPTTSSGKTAEKSNVSGFSSLAKPVEPTLPLATQPRMPATSSVKTHEKFHMPGVPSPTKPVQPTLPLATQPRMPAISSVKTHEKFQVPGVPSPMKPVQPTLPLATQPRTPATSSVKTHEKSHVPGVPSLMKPVQLTVPLATQPQIPVTTNIKPQVIASLPTSSPLLKSVESGMPVVRNGSPPPMKSTRPATLLVTPVKASTTEEKSHVTSLMEVAGPSMTLITPQSFSHRRLVGKYMGSSFADKLKRVSPAMLSPSERASFRQRGQEFLRKAKESRTPVNEQRQRLIEQGRQILQRSRENSRESSPGSSPRTGRHAGHPTTVSSSLRAKLNQIGFLGITPFNAVEEQNLAKRKDANVRKPEGSGGNEETRVIRLGHQNSHNRADPSPIPPKFPPPQNNQTQEKIWEAEDKNELGNNPTPPSAHMASQANTFLKFVSCEPLPGQGPELSILMLSGGSSIELDQETRKDKEWWRFDDEEGADPTEVSAIKQTEGPAPQATPPPRIFETGSGDMQQNKPPNTADLAETAKKNGWGFEDNLGETNDPNLPSNETQADVSDHGEWSFDDDMDI